MTKVLVINSSPSGEGSLSKKMVREFLTKYQAKHGDVELVNRDVSDGSSTGVDGHWLNAFYGANDTQESQAKKEEAMTLVQEIKDADAIVISSPVYNFGLPAQLKAWFDTVIIPGVSFSYEGGPHGILDDKPVYVFAASASGYQGLDQWQKNFHQNAIIAMFDWIGISTVHFVDGVSRSDESKAHAMERVKEFVDTLALQA
jgi:FMN-dependent NADH-azoreductase